MSAAAAEVRTAPEPAGFLPARSAALAAVVLRTETLADRAPTSLRTGRSARWIVEPWALPLLAPIAPLAPSAPSAAPASSLRGSRGLVVGLAFGLTIVGVMVVAYALLIR